MPHNAASNSLSVLSACEGPWALRHLISEGWNEGREGEALDAGRPSWGKGRCGISNSNLQTVRAAPERGKSAACYLQFLKDFLLGLQLLRLVGPSHSPSQTLAHQEQSLQEGLRGSAPCGLPLLWKDTQDNETVRPWMASSHCGGQSIGAFTSRGSNGIGFRVPSMPEPQELLTAGPHLWTYQHWVNQGSTEILCQERFQNLGF